MFFKIGVLQNLANFTNKILYPVLESLFNNVAGLKRSETFIKETPAHVFSHEIDEIFKNTFYYRTTLVAASEIKKVFNFQSFLLWLAFFWNMWLYKWSKFHSLQMEIEKKSIRKRNVSFAQLNFAEWR